MDADRAKTTVLGFLGVFVVFVLLLYFVGVDEFLAELSRADAGEVSLVVAVTVLWLVAWGQALRTVLAVLGVAVSPLKAFLVFAGAMFSNNVTPFGQAGGEPITALLIAETTDMEYERGLAAIASVDTLNFVPSVSLALVGAGIFATEVTFGRDLRLAVAAVAVLAAAVPFALYLGWKSRYRVERAVVGALTPVLWRVARWVPWVSWPGRAAVERRIGRFFGAIERVADNPRGLGLALGFSSLGWFCQMLGLWLAFAAIGVPVPLSAMLFVVPAGAVAGVTPLPGGAGGIEGVLLFLLIAAPLPGVTESAALAAIAIYRGAVYWVPTLVGGAVVSFVGADRARAL